MPNERSIYTVKAFTYDPEGGNAAAVVADAQGLTDGQMSGIARVMGFSETAFVLSAEVQGAEFRLRWFTPEVEVPLCGHATIATLRVLAELGRLPVDGVPRRIETKSGVLRVSVEKLGRRQIHRLEIPVPQFENVEISEDRAKILFDLSQSDRNPVLPTVSDGHATYVPVLSVGTLRKIQPDLHRMRSDPEHSLVCFFTGETLEVGHAWHCRFFAPGFGIDEDPVTGAINGPLGAYWYQFVDLHKPAEVEYVGEQGDIIGCPGRVHVRVCGDGRRATDVEIGGEAVVTKEGPLAEILARIACK